MASKHKDVVKTVSFKAKVKVNDVDKDTVKFPKERKAEIESAKVEKVTMFGEAVAPRFTLPKGKV